MVTTYCQINQMDGCLLEWLRQQPLGEPIGVVHSIFDKVINFIAVDGSMLFSLAKNEVSQSPGMMRTLENNIFSKMGASLIPTKSIYLVDKNLLQIGNWQWEFSNANIWNRGLRLQHYQTKLLTTSSLLRLNQFILENGATGGMFSAWKSVTYPHWKLPDDQEKNIYFPLFKNGLEQLKQEIKANKLHKFYLKFAGLGIGLTPSGDDFLTGLLATWQYFDASLYKKVEKCNTDWLQQLKRRTTTISYFMLKQCLEGQVNEALLDVLDNLDGNPIPYLRRILAIGSTSGTDMLTGVSFAYQQLIDYKEEK